MQNQENKVRGPAIRLSTVATTTRQTPKTDFGTVMRDGLIKAGNVAVEGLQVAAPFVPGSAIVSAAIAGANIAGNVSQPGYGSGGTGAFGTTASGLTAGGGGPGTLSAPSTAGSYGANGALTIPGRAPGTGTNLSTPASSFATGGATAGTTSGASDSFNQMMSATRTMAEFQASFNLQYLQLQEKIQTDTRQFNLVSNIMKTKHDAAKNALNNVR
ncbi:MAG: hypothetical protein IT384_27135 [Deltaproteobacteria bacterium]|nr:hypothetical protein [Deltaproteobacteria bacterium]